MIDVDRMSIGEDSQTRGSDKLGNLSAQSVVQGEEPIIVARGISKHYGGVRALEGIDFFLRPDEHAALVGDNGAGKSTLVKILCGAEIPDSGDVSVDGVRCHFKSPLDARRAGIETVHQNLALADDLDVTANLFLGREQCVDRLTRFGWLDRSRMRRESREMLERTGVQIPELTARVRVLSGGQRQGVAIARAAGWHARVIIMDEPTAALGVQETKRVEGIIQGLRRAEMGVLIVSHNLRQVFSLVDRIWVLRHGRMVGSQLTRETTPEEIIAMITGVWSAGSNEFA